MGTTARCQRCSRCSWCSPPAHRTWSSSAILGDAQAYGFEHTTASWSSSFQLIHLVCWHVSDYTKDSEDSLDKMIFRLYQLCVPFTKAFACDQVARWAHPGCLRSFLSKTAVQPPSNAYTANETHHFLRRTKRSTNWRVEKLNQQFSAHPWFRNTLNLGSLTWSGHFNSKYIYSTHGEFSIAIFGDERNRKFKTKKNVMYFFPRISYLWGEGLRYQEECCM